MKTQNVLIAKPFRTGIFLGLGILTAETLVALTATFLIPVIANFLGSM